MARGRLWARAARVSQAAFAWKCPDGACANLFEVPARLAGHARRRELKFDPAWPANHRAVKAWDRIQALPDPG